MELNILASKSPRRKKLLNQVGFKFSIVPSGLIEYQNKDLPSEALVETLAREKALRVAKLYNEKIIIGADTVVFHEGQILGKPKNKNESFKMLKSLSGKSHEVITGVSIIQLNKNIDHTFNSRTFVTLIPLSDKEILSYIKNHNPSDKAGSYGIQDGFSIYIKKINGCYYNVMGFPLSKFFQNYLNIFPTF